MTRDDLRGIIEGISDEQLKRILDINSSDIGKAKRTVEELSAQLSEAQEKVLGYEAEIGGLKLAVNEAEGMREKVKELQKVIDERKLKDEAQELENKLAQRFATVTEGAEFLNKYTHDGLYAEFKAALSDVNNNGKSDTEIYSKITKGRENLFLPENSGIPKVISASGGIAQSLADGDVREIMGLTR